MRKLGWNGGLLRTNTALLKPSPEQESALLALFEHSARLWNVANYERRQALFKHGRTPSYPSQCKALKKNEHFVALGTGKSQALLHKLKEAWTAYWGLKKLEKEGKLPPHITKVRPPGYWKGRDGSLDPRLVAVRSDCWSMDEEGQTVTVARGLKVRYASGQMWVGKKGRLEVQHDRVGNRWYAHIPVDVGMGRTKHGEGRAAIDIGVCNLVALAVEGAPKPRIWSGRQVLADWRYWTKRIADREAGLKRVNGKNSSLELSRLYSVRKRRLDHAVKAMLRHLFEVLEEEGVGCLMFGDLTGIRAGADYGGRTNQKIHNFWPFAQIRKRVCELAEEYGIDVEPVDERGSSKTCAFHPDEQKGRIHRGLYRCERFGVVYNADAGGAANLLHGNGKVAAVGVTEQANHGLPSGSGLLAQPLLYRWDYQEWSQAPAARSQRL